MRPAPVLRPPFPAAPPPSPAPRPRFTGCSRCTIESGFTCALPTAHYPSLCYVCGNGVVEAGEQCDDSDFQDGDGCSWDCKVEYGYTCTIGAQSNGRAPSVCTKEGGHH